MKQLQKRKQIGTYTVERTYLRSYSRTKLVKLVIEARQRELKNSFARDRMMRNFSLRYPYSVTAPLFPSSLVMDGVMRAFSLVANIQKILLIMKVDIIAPATEVRRGKSTIDNNTE